LQQANDRVPRRRGWVKGEKPRKEKDEEKYALAVYGVRRIGRAPGTAERDDKIASKDKNGGEIKEKQREDCKGKTGKKQQRRT